MSADTTIIEREVGTGGSRWSLQSKKTVVPSGVCPDRLCSGVTLDRLLAVHCWRVPCVTVVCTVGVLGGCVRGAASRCSPRCVLEVQPEVAAVRARGGRGVRRGVLEVGVHCAGVGVLEVAWPCGGARGAVVALVAGAPAPVGCCGAGPGRGGPAPGRGAPPRPA